ncbi:MAG TPA: DUF3000 domain-containing protein [Actinospica sp.]|jgi:hypothetical protein|nr:DUF3000 domain-containing protein [Actinospica sp.]
MAQHPHPVSSHRGSVAQAPLDTAPPEVFAAAVDGIAALRPRPGLEFEPLPAPRRLAAYSHALSATVAEQHDEEELELGSGRFVLLYEPGGHEEWRGSWRCVTFLQADLEPEIAEDPLLAEVTWSWLCEALAPLGCAALGGTVSRCSSSGFGELAGQSGSTSVELRASWSPLPPGARRLAASTPGSPVDGWSPETAWTGLAAHVQAWSDCLATAVGLPPELAGIARLPRIGG